MWTVFAILALNVILLVYPDVLVAPLEYVMGKILSLLRRNGFLIVITVSGVLLGLYLIIPMSLRMARTEPWKKMYAGTCTWIRSRLRAR